MQKICVETDLDTFYPKILETRALFLQRNIVSLFPYTAPNICVTWLCVSTSL